MIMHRVYVLTVKSREQNDQWTVGEVCLCVSRERVWEDSQIEITTWTWPDLRSETGVGKSLEEEKALADSAPDQGAVRRSRPWNRWDTDPESFMHD